MKKIILLSIRIILKVEIHLMEIAPTSTSTSTTDNNKYNSSSSFSSYFKSTIFPTSLDSFSGLNNQNYLTSRDSFEGIDQNYNYYRPSKLEDEDEKGEMKTSLSSYLSSILNNNNGNSLTESKSSKSKTFLKKLFHFFILFPFQLLRYHLNSVFHVYYSCFRLPRTTELDPTIELIYGTFWTVVHRKGRVGEFELLWPYILGSVMLISEKKHGNPYLNFHMMNHMNNQNHNRNYYQWMKPIHKAIMINTSFTLVGYIIGIINYKIFRITIPRNITPDVMLASYQIIGSIFANIFFKVNQSKDYQQQKKYTKNSLLLNTNNYDFKI